MKENVEKSKGKTPHKSLPKNVNSDVTTKEHQNHHRKEKTDPPESFRSTDLEQLNDKQDPTTNDKETGKIMERRKCFNCNAKGHIAINCPNKDISKWCNFCSKTNHDTNECWSIHNIHISTGCQQVSIIHVSTKQFQKRGENPSTMILQGCHPVSGHGGRRRVAETIDGTKKRESNLFWRAYLSPFFVGKKMESRSAHIDFVVEIS